MNDTRECFSKWIRRDYPLIAVWIGPIVLIGSLLIQGRVIFWGTAYLQFLPWHLAGWEQIVSGHFPLWNSFNGYGTPLLANYQSAFIYPPNIMIWLMALLAGVKGIAVAQTLLVMGHLVVAGYGMVILTREIGFTKLGQAVSAIAFSLSGYLVSRASFLSMNAVLAWVPWVLFIGLRIAKISTWKQAFKQKDILLAVLFHSLLLLSGHAQLAWYTILLSLFWTITWSWYHHGFSKILLTFGIITISLLVAGGLSSVQLIPTAELLLQSQRAEHVEYTYALNYSIWPWRLLTVFSPNLFGNPARGNYWVTADNYWEDNIYTGLATIILGISSIVKLAIGRYRKDKKWIVLISFSLIMIIVSLLLSLGKNTPIFPFLYHYAPTFDMFQAPARFSIWFVVLISILAGLGVEHWSKPSGRWLYWSRLLAAGAVGITATSIMIWFVLRAQFEDTYIIGVAETGMFLSIFLMLNLFAPRTKEEPTHASPLMILCILVFLIGDLIYNNWDVNPGLSVNNFDQFTLTGGQTIPPEEQSLVYITPTTEDEVKFSKFFRFDSFHPVEGWDRLKEYFIPNSNIYGHVSSVNNFDPLSSARYDQWTEVVYSEITTRESEANGFWGIGTVISENTAAPIVINPIKDEQSRFRWFSCAISAIDMRDSAQIVRNQLISGMVQNVIAIEGISPLESNCDKQDAVIMVDVIQSSPEYTRVEINTDKPGWLMQLSANYPGWKARIDGKDVTLYYGDILFRTIYVPAGKHSIEFLYRPGYFYTGLIISLWFLFVLITYGLVRRKYKEHYG